MEVLYDGVHNPDLHFPMTPVADAAEEVVETGKDVTRFRTYESLGIERFWLGTSEDRGKGSPEARY